VLNTKDIPNGFCKVDVKLDDNGEIFQCMMIAGHVGIALLEETDDATGKTKKNTLQPSPEWFLFIKGDAEIKAQSGSQGRKSQGRRY